MDTRVGKYTCDTKVQQVAFSALVLFYISLFFRSFTVAIPRTSVRVVPADIVVAFVVLPTIVVLFARGQIVVSRISFRLLALVCVFLAYHGYLLTKSPQPSWGFSLLFLLCRDILILTIVSVVFKELTISQFNKAVFRTSAVMSILMGGAYIVFLAIGANSHWLLDEVVLNNVQGDRAQWFVSDPNFFGILLLVGFLCGLWVTRERNSLVNNVLLTVIGGVIVTTLSRSVIGLCIVTSVLFAFSGTGRSINRINITKTGVVGSAILSGFAIVLSSVPLSQLKKRIAISGGRAELWSPLIVNIDNHLLTGAGLRASQIVLGRYSHNSYLTMLYDGGIIGLGIFAAICASVTLPALRAWLRGELDALLPWWLALVALVPFLFVFSHTYQPITWLIIGVVSLVGSTSGHSGSDVRISAARLDQL